MYSVHLFIAEDLSAFIIVDAEIVNFENPGVVALLEEACFLGLLRTSGVTLTVSIFLLGVPGICCTSWSSSTVVLQSSDIFGLNCLAEDRVLFRALKIAPRRS